MDTGSVRIETHQSGEDWVHITIIERPVGEYYRGMLTDALDYAEELGVTGWLSDMRQARVMDPEDEAWSQQVWLPRAMELGLKRLALVQPENIFSRMQAQRWERNPMQVWESLPYEMRLFKDLDDARHWLSGHEARNSVLPGF